MENIRSDVLAINGGHDASVTFVDKNETIRIFEYERFIKKRYAIFTKTYSNTGTLGTDDNQRVKFLDYIKSNLKEYPKYILHSELSEIDFEYISQYFPNVTMYKMGHHMSHCMGSFYQSTFESALIFSLDGGGEDYISENQLDVRSTNIVKYENGQIEHICLGTNFNPGIYGTIGYYISEISKGGKDLIISTSDKFALSFAGKLMGLCAYGNVRDEWVEPLKKFYNHHPYYHCDDYGKDTFYELESSLGIDSNNRKDFLSGKDSYDLAATNQYAFEEVCFEYIKPYVEKYNLNVVFSGGCALNVLFNQKLKEYLNSKNLDLYVSPHPNDCGVSYGHFCHFTNFKNQINSYCGLDILDREMIPFYCEKYKDRVQFSSTEKICELICDGKIGGILNGYSEVGPRALGNRSIICDPSFVNMKDMLNSKVKFREWFRPFAPVCRVEDKDLFFENAYNSPYMTFAPTVKEEYVNKIPSVVHADRTARLQTVSKEQHSLFYEILTWMNDNQKIPVILNTSFNIRGNPILTEVKDAFYVLENTQLDFLVVENLLFIK
jgi:carbamoyltransferase